MGNMTASAGEFTPTAAEHHSSAPLIKGSIDRLVGWMEQHDYRGYDTFDGLNARYVRWLTLENAALRTVLLQGVRRFPLNLRPLLGISKMRSTKGMGFVARGCIRLHKATGDPVWANRAQSALDWLVENQTTGYRGVSWGNHFDYQSRTFYLPKGTPTIVWTSLIGHAFLDAYEHFGTARYLEIANGACEHIVHELEISPEEKGVCISYVPGQNSQVHNANVLGGSLLARTGSITRNEEYVDLAGKALEYTAHYQRADGSWFYGEKQNLHWVDNFHTAYVLDCFKYYSDATGDTRFLPQMERGYEYWKSTFFLSDGTPRYYNNKTLPLDIQCSSQAIDTFVFFQKRDPEAIDLAVRTAQWTIGNMQDRSGYFYYRRYSKRLVNKTPTLHWGQATMLCALAGLYKTLSGVAE